MPLGLTGVSSFSNTTQSPATGDPANQSAFSVPLQRLLDNCKWLYEQIVTSGVFAIRKVADLTALAALTGMTDGQVAWVAKRGLFFYVDPDSTSPVTNLVVQPGTGSGRWFHGDYLTRNAANGLAGLDASAKVPAANVPQTLLVASYVEPVGATGSAGTMTDIAGSTVTTAGAQTGDRLEVEAVVGFGMTGVIDVGARLVLGASTTQCQAGGSVSTSGTGVSTLFTLVGARVLASGDISAGNVSWKVQGYASGAGSGQVTVYAQRTRLYRP